MSGRGEAAGPAVRRVGRQGRKVVLPRGKGSGGDRERDGGGVLSCALLLRERGGGATREGVMAVTGRGRRRRALVHPPSRAKGVAWIWGKGKGMGSGVPPFRANGAVVNGKGKERRAGDLPRAPSFCARTGRRAMQKRQLCPLASPSRREWAGEGEERGGGGRERGREGREEKLGGVLRSLHTQFCTNWVAGNGLGEMGAGGKRKQAHVPDHPFPSLLSSHPRRPGPIRVEKGSQEGTADAAASRAAPFVRKKRAHEPLLAWKGHEGTPSPPLSHRRLPFPRGPAATFVRKESTPPPPLSHRRTTPFARKGGTPLPVPTLPPCPRHPFRAGRGAQGRPSVPVSPRVAQQGPRPPRARSFRAT
ncbi:hypothetical protein EDB84DRAFT_1439281 [Lactarius hengduanensis]|nr:hypothetical protein EDB84DRAFT_1439281 [Lactarius hengduanensis]